MNQRMWSTFDIKSATTDANGKRTLSGVASTPSMDRGDDIVDPQGMQMSLPLPFLWMHNSRDPIGWVTAARVTAKGVEIDVEIATVSEPGALQDRLTLAWQMLKNKLVRGLSIGFRGIETSRIEGTWGTHFLKSELFEVSAVTIPMNAECSITSVKAFDRASKRVVHLDVKSSTPPESTASVDDAARTQSPVVKELDTNRQAASGQSPSRVVRLDTTTPPGVSGTATGPVKKTVVHLN